MMKGTGGNEAGRLRVAQRKSRAGQREDLGKHRAVRLPVRLRASAAAHSFTQLVPQVAQVDVVELGAVCLEEAHQILDPTLRDHRIKLPRIERFPFPAATHRSGISSTARAVAGG